MIKQGFSSIARNHRPFFANNYILDQNEKGGTKKQKKWLHYGWEVVRYYLNSFFLGRHGFCGLERCDVDLSKVNRIVQIILFILMTLCLWYVPNEYMWIMWVAFGITVLVRILWKKRRSK